MDTNPDQGVASPEDRLTALFEREESPPKEPAEAETPQADDSPQEPAEEVQQDQPEAEPEEELDELDLGDIRLQLPKTAAERLKSERLMHADYTKKTQELADQRRALEEQQQRLQEAQQFQAVALDKAAEIRAIERQLAQFEQVDWNGLVISDPAEAMRLNLMRQQLQEQHGKAHRELQHLGAQEQQKTAQARQQTLQRAQEELARDIKGWGPELVRSISDTGKTYGFTDVELSGLADARMVKVLHDAHQWQQLQKSKVLAVKKVADARPITVKAARPVQQSQAVVALQEATARLKRSGKTEDAQAALERLFEHKRKR